MRNIVKYLVCIITIVIPNLFILLDFVNGQQIDIDFPGGNIIVSEKDNLSTLYYDISSDTVMVRPDLRDTRGDWFYWFFRISGATNKTLFFQFPDKYIGSYGPALSKDGGETWSWLYDDVSSIHNYFTYTFDPDDNEIMFSSGIPYLQANFDSFIEPYKNNRNILVETLTTSKKGRNIEKVHIFCSANEPKYKVLITARSHACEAMANYVQEGLITSVLDDNGGQMKWIRENVEFLIIPFLDKDGVEDGDQGKNRKPHDHNRDYIGKSIYNSIAELREKIPEWSENKLMIGLDLHCPYLFERGSGWNEHIYFVGSGKKEIAKKQKDFRDILVKNQKGDLKVHPEKSILEHGVSWNNSTKKVGNFTDWLNEYEKIFFASTLEFPYANNDGQIITPHNARLFGKDLAIAISVYLQKLK